MRNVDWRGIQWYGNYVQKNQLNAWIFATHSLLSLFQLQNEKRRLERDLEEIKRQKEEQDDENERLRQEVASLRYVFNQRHCMYLPFFWLVWQLGAVEHTLSLSQITPISWYTYLCIAILCISADALIEKRSLKFKMRQEVASLRYVFNQRHCYCSHKLNYYDNSCSKICQFTI